MQYGGREVLAIAVHIGLAFIKGVGKCIGKTMAKQYLDSSRPFIGSMLNALIKVILLISTASMVGKEVLAILSVKC